jgi:hypothetical protein
MLMLICSISGVVNFRKKSNLQPLFILLPISLTTELLVEYMIYKGKPFYFIYHIYEVIDFYFFSFLFYLNSKNRSLKKLIKIGLILYPVSIIFITLNYSGFIDFPSLQYSLESIFLSVISIVFLFNLTPDENHSISKNNMFWICIGLIVFHCGILVMNGSYNYLKSLSEKNALFIKDWINMGFNYLLYIFILIATVWPKNTMK